MPHRAKTYLYDILQAATSLTSFAQGKTYADYLAEPLLRAGVERMFEIIGEALTQMLHYHPELAERIPNYRTIISFRNVLIHGYRTIEHQVVWSTLHDDLPLLMEQVRALLEE